MSDPNCLFCKIVSKQLPSSIVYEDDQVLAFKDISPQSPVHVLIIPKVHVTGLDGLTSEHQTLMGHILLVAKQLATTLGIAESGYRLVTNCGADARQTVFHLHFHLMGGMGMSGRMA